MCLPYGIDCQIFLIQLHRSGSTLFCALSMQAGKDQPALQYPKLLAQKGRREENQSPQSRAKGGTQVVGRGVCCNCSSSVIRVGRQQCEVPQALFRLVKPVFETTYEAQPTPMPRLPQHLLPHRTHDSGMCTLNPRTFNPRPLKTA